MIPGVISEILNHKSGPTWTIAPEATVFEAIERMARHNIGVLPVVANGRLVGMVSERDYTRKVALNGRSSRETTVREILAAPVTVPPTESIESCMKRMTGERVRHVAVVKGEELVGLVSIGDLVNWIINAQSATIHQLESYITGHYPGAD